MKATTFLLNAIKLATAPSLDNAPILEIEKGDLKDIISYLDKEGFGYTAETESELRFSIGGVNFTAIENDRGDELSLYGKPISPVKEGQQRDLPEEPKITEQSNQNEANMKEHEKAASLSALNDQDKNRSAKQQNTNTKATATASSKK